MDKNNLISTLPAPVTVQQTGDHNLNVTNQPGGNMTIVQNPPTIYDDDGKPYTPITPVRFDVQNGILYLGNDQVTIPVELVQPDLLAPEELPYVNALCEVYAEKLGKSLDEIKPSAITSLPTNLQRHFSSQRKAYYRAEYASHIARETFADGEQQFQALKDDAFEGIEITYYDEDHENGYDRLKAVLEKITNTTLSKSALINVIGLIGNLEKKGICHILVNDDVINSWVNIDE